MQRAGSGTARRRRLSWGHRRRGHPAGAASADERREHGCRGQGPRTARARAASAARPASCLRPGWPRPTAAGMKWENTLCGWGGRLHGFRQPLWGEPLRSWPQRRALTGRSTDCPTRHQLTGPRSLAPKQLQLKAAPPTLQDELRRMRLEAESEKTSVFQVVRQTRFAHKRSIIEP